MKEYVKSNFLKVVGEVVKAKAGVNDKIWPPLCAGFLYQPKRPSNK